MAPRNGSADQSSASPDDSVERDDLPGELLGEDLVDPGAYEVAADETEAEELASEPVEPDTDLSQLTEAETVAMQARNSRPQRRVAAGETLVAKKGVPTPKAGRPRPDAVRRTTPASFARESVEELKKVVWPTWPQVQQYFWAVLVLVVAVITFVGLLDLAFGWALLKAFG